MRSTLLGAAAAMALGAILAAGSSYAGDENTIHLKQESPLGSLHGNTLSVDQSTANRSAVGGPNLPVSMSPPELTLDMVAGGTPSAALQRGEGNVATLTMTGDGGTLLLMQDTSPGGALQMPGSGTSNYAEVTTIGAALGAVVQMGTGNRAELDLDNSRGLIGQFGTDLNAKLQVGSGGQGRIVQVGHNNRTELMVSAGADVTYSQIGNNLTTVNPAAVQVFATNPGNITITQTGF